MSDICDGENLWQWSQMEIKLIAFGRPTISQKIFVDIILSYKIGLKYISYCNQQLHFSFRCLLYGINILVEVDSFQHHFGWLLDELTHAPTHVETCNFNKSNTPLWVFFPFFKFYKWFQIAQSISYIWCDSPTLREITFYQCSWAFIIFGNC